MLTYEHIRKHEHATLVADEVRAALRRAEWLVESFRENRLKPAAFRRRVERCLNFAARWTEYLDKTTLVLWLKEGDANELLQNLDHLRYWYTGDQTYWPGALAHITTIKNS